MRLVTLRKHKDGDSVALYLLWKSDHSEFVESSVLYISGREIPWVVCLPSAIGCAEGCAICAMPRCYDPIRLTEKDLWNIFSYSLQQVMYSGNLQVSFMGQGEPLHNQEGVFGFCHKLSHRFPESVIGISTVGIASGITALMNEHWVSRMKLQVSVHAWPGRKRVRIVPAEHDYPIHEALSAARHLALKWGTMWSLNCVLLDGVNDSDEDARNIAALALLGASYVKVSDFNPYRNCVLSGSKRPTVDRFCETLASFGVDVHRFRSIGRRIFAGCGQTRIGISQVPNLRRAPTAQIGS